MKLGATVRDEVTGFVGVVTARATYLTGVPRVQVEGRDLISRPVEVWVDEERVRLVRRAKRSKR